MAVLGGGTETLLNAVRKRNPDGSAAVIAEMLTRSNEMLLDAPHVEANNGTGHTVSVRAGLPQVYWAAFNQPVPSSTSLVGQVTEETAMLKAYSEIDVALMKLYGDRAATARAQEDAPFIEAMAQEHARTMFYGNSALAPTSFTGLATRFSRIPGSGAPENALNVLSCGGSGTANTSIYLVGWGENTVFCTYPQGTEGGIQVTPHAPRVSDRAGGKITVQETEFLLRTGLVVKDWRYVVRISNIVAADLAAGTGTQAFSAATNVLRAMNNALELMPTLGNVTPVFYGNRGVRTAIRNMAMQQSSSLLGTQKATSEFGPAGGRPTYQDVPIARVDAILNTEATVA